MLLGLRLWLGAAVRRVGRVNRSALIGLIAVLVLLVGLAVWWKQFHREAPAGPPSSAEVASPPADVVAQAMKNAPPVAPVDSAAIKARWQDEVRGADLGGLDAKQQEVFLRFANAERCTCGCGYTLAGCKASDMSCEVSGGMIDALLDSIRAGKIKTARGIRGRPVHPG